MSGPKLPGRLESLQAAPAQAGVLTLAPVALPVDLANDEVCPGVSCAARVGTMATPNAGDEHVDVLGGPDAAVHEDELRGPDAAAHEDELGGPDAAAHEDELGGDAPGSEDELGGPDPGHEDVLS